MDQASRKELEPGALLGERRGLGQGGDVSLQRLCWA